MLGINRLKERDIYENYFEKVYKTTFYILKNEELAKDATHDTFIKVFKNLGKMKDQTKINAWITTIASRTAIDIYNKNKKLITYELKEEHAHISDEFNYTKDELESYLKSIPPEQKQVLILKYIEDLPEKEIAKQLSIKLGTVKSRIHRAKQKLFDLYQLGGDSDVQE
ncbi:RNA polymerase sigma factor [Ornithinibacillus halotolerans]|uniref:RNA polymerase sigma factor n=1 Tax=Ornithinibacillus halotolerans TaxID=1274357 RepID=A0A916RQV3_9BACI|nr:RNA polymerase sigma factor [Ornithinibacillus halotolerans]GGA63656.1 RNA polymerase sigma factor [Ornithinibacillus halotolerans]